MPPQLALARLRFLSETGGADDFSGLSVNGQFYRSAGSGVSRIAAGADVGSTYSVPLWVRAGEQKSLYAMM
jgi:hypothetical protein